MPSILSSPFVAVFVVLATIVLLNGSPITAAKCIDEFEKGCVSDKDCCGRRNVGQFKVKCVMAMTIADAVGDEIPTDLVVQAKCMSGRSEMLNSLTKESMDHTISVEDIAVLLKDYFYQLPKVKEVRNSKKGDDYEDDSLFYSKMAHKYHNDFAKLVVTLEKIYKIKDTTVFPNLIRDFLTIRDGVDVKKVGEELIQQEAEEDAKLAAEAARNEAAKNETAAEL